jgi:RNA polymerase sigma-70 factor, ECF subfamily
MDDPIAQLLIRIAAQERAAFRDIYAATSAKLMGVLLRILNDRALSEDALQEVYTRVWLRAGRFDASKGRGMTWLITMARNHAIDLLRARRDVTAEDGAVEAMVDRGPNAEGQSIAMGEARRVADCFATLEPDRAAAVRSAYLDGLSYQELADHHAVPLNTMRTWLRRSLLRLRECLDQ